MQGIVIETRGWRKDADERIDAYEGLRSVLHAERPRFALDFIHVPE